jgi:hypothetical protein
VTVSLQPLLHNELVVLRAPTQVWSAPDGSIGAAAIHGIIHSDVRVVCGVRVRVGGSVAEHLVTSGETADAIRIDAVLRHLDDATPDPGVRLRIDRTVTIDGCSEILTISTRHSEPITTTVEIEIDVDATPIDLLKQGWPAATAVAGLVVEDTAARWFAETVSASVSTGSMQITERPHGLLLSANVLVPPRGSISVGWRIEAVDRVSAVHGTVDPAPWSTPHEAGFELDTLDPRLTRWVERALDDLDTLRLTVAGHPDQQFLAAGAPWFFTLFGRDSLWSARMMLPLGTRLAGDTLRVLARLQAGDSDPLTAAQPGKIMHELRRQSLVVNEDVTLPPLYYGTIDATPLWICLLHDAWRAGLDKDEVRALLPTLEAALAWMRDYGDADGDGLLEYIDHSGRGLANQGWKDSGDSVQWRDGTLAQGPIALCEVQAYAFEAAMGGADLLEAFDRPGAAEWRQWAMRVHSAFHEKFWITDPEVTGPLGPYPAIALDLHKRRVDTVTSNLGHLLGTGLLNDEQSALVAARLASPELNSGYGLRTMSSDSSGYWPLSYHGGSVWTHDTAIAIAGLAKTGHHRVARSLARGLLRAAESFGFRMPELYSGDPASSVARPVPYPASCQPQAWSATAAIAVMNAMSGDPQSDTAPTTEP